jgi:RNA polymerase sigma-70 factor (ECF subfamily)
VLRLLPSPESPLAGETIPWVSADPLRSLVAAAANGDRHAERTVLVALGPRMLRVVRSVLGSGHPDTEDVLQQSMVAVHRALPTFRNECSVHHFASRIVVQTAMNARRRSRYRERHTPSVAPEQLTELARSDESPAESLAAARRRETLRQLLCELPVVQAEVLALHTMLGYSVEETAAAVRAPVNTVRSRLRSALATLRARVLGDDDLLDVVKGGS